MNSMGGSELDARRAAYSQAVRHSQRVRRLKILLPASAVAISLIFVAVSIVRSLLPENIEVKGATIENGQIVMEKPAISGRNADGIFYSMTAARALQSIASPNIMTLENIAAQMPVNDQIIAKVNAKGGIYDRSANTLDMTQPFSLHLSSGLIANFRSAKLDVKNGTMTSKDTVSITAPKATVVAQSINIEDKGQTIVFDGGVQVNMHADVIHEKGN
ncbi:LPS export ABC transporter periplasmic protein LptC [Rhizobium sp. C1]|uniref:LPS export ABC transporter periplasmic protein LptC n=1 Tax=Rhizobium sp. C1 TaxID=1349799 RepID=UPI001E287A21|nr:LPS export ABC transporter periplasmic protein LptC [Rhizobium sp. C1]MCD2179855.1 LPS export ABC transporter periplasmic protein LptC [Rhizobium sp. C1]